MFIKAMYNNEECLLNADYIVDIFNADKWVADVYVLDIDRDCYKANIEADGDVTWDGFTDDNKGISESVQENDGRG